MQAEHNVLTKWTVSKLRRLQMFDRHSNLLVHESSIGSLSLQMWFKQNCLSGLHGPTTVIFPKSAEPESSLM